MLKKIALVGIFAVTSVVSFGSAVNAETSRPDKVSQSIVNTSMKGYCPCPHGC